MTANECIKTRRSIRQFTDEPVSEKVLAQIVETASFAPSWKNTQITRYIAVTGDLKAKIAAEGFDMFPGNGAIVGAAPVMIAVTVIKNRCGYERDGSFTTDRKDSWQMFDAGIASQTFCLAAHEQGIGSVIMGIFDRARIEKLLNLPEDRELVAIIPIGHPAVNPDCPKRKTVEDLLSYM